MPYQLWGDRTRMLKVDHVEPKYWKNKISLQSLFMVNPLVLDIKKTNLPDNAIKITGVK